MNEAISRGYNDNEQYAKLPSLSGTIRRSWQRHCAIF